MKCTENKAMTKIKDETEGKNDKKVKNESDIMTDMPYQGIKSSIVCSNVLDVRSQSKHSSIEQL